MLPVKIIDNFLNKITMYRLVLYYLIILIGIAAFFGLFGWISYNPLAIIFSALFIVTICYITNIVFAWAFQAPTNFESVYITALILTLIISPILNAHDTNYFLLATWASLWAIASKFIFAIGKKHLFNPAAFGVAMTAFTINQSASWWIGTGVLMPFVLLGGLLVTRKIQRFDLVLSFLGIALITIIGFQMSAGTFTSSTFWRIFTDTPLFFFAFVMLTEPLTTPPTRPLRISYGTLTGFLFAPALHLGSVYSTPELALLVGNIYSYIVSPKQKLILKLKERLALTKDTYDFVFVSGNNKNLNFRPGQYLEWTLAHEAPDSRGNRRYFTIASSPTEKEIHMGVKFYPEPSSFKKTLATINSGNTIVASQLAGDFTLPHDPRKKLVFIAGGIGITPFRSMIKYLIDKNEKRDIVLLYSNKSMLDIAYKKIFDEAKNKLGIKTIYIVNEASRDIPQENLYAGRITANLILNTVPDFKERMFYLSGPRSMVVAFDETLKNMGVSRTQIKKDFFPGFA